MIKNLQATIKWATGMIAMLLLLTSSSSAFTGPVGCSDAGMASASEDSVCYNSPVTLTLSGYLGSIFQWQRFDGTTWVDETGTGSNSDTYIVSLIVTTQYRAIVTEVSCPADTSNAVTIEVGVIPAPAASNTGRCGPGIVNLTGTGSGTLEWYANQTGGVPIATGSNTTAYIPASTTLWLQDNVLGGSSLASALQITEANLGNNDDLEVQNVSPLSVDVTGWKVLINNSYTDINSVNANIQVLNGILQPGDILTWTDLAGATNYWGSNMLWNPGAFPTFTGWVLILDDQNNPMDFMVWNWPDANIQGMSIVVGTSTITPGSIWSGDGINSSAVLATEGLSRIGNSDNDNASDFAVAPLSILSTNPLMTIPFTGFGCASPRIPVDVNISASDAITIDASATSFCVSGSSTLTAVSNNANYSYTWSPATGLSGTTGATVTSTPPGPGNYTYVVIGDDGTCSNVDTVTISVGTPTAAGIASTVQDTICLGKEAYLSLTGSSGFIQWQSLSGGVWVNETGTGSDSAVYVITPVNNTTYRAFLSSGSCPPDSSNVIDIIVISISNPVTTNDSVCGSGSLTLLASGSGTLNWYNVPVGGTPVTTGGSYTFSATQTTTYYVEALVGTEYHTGPLTSGIGNQSSTAGNNTGLGFDVFRPVTIDVVHVYPAQTGTVTINLRQSAGGPILATYSQAVTAFSGKVIVPVGFSVPVGTGYRMEIQNGGPTLQQNTSGATYPYTDVNGPISITGYYNPNFNTGGIYLWMYDWIVSEGCRSARIPAIGVVNSFPSIPTISQNWNSLTSSSPVGNQWFLNGVLIQGATDQFYEAAQTGNYTVVVTINGCSTSSAVFQVLSIGLNEISGDVVNIYPNPVNHTLQISMQDIRFDELNVTDITGRIVYTSSIANKALQSVISLPVSGLPNGIYILELKSGSAVSRKQFVVEH